ncbi:unnamed protein product [Aphanomyces euteiches]|uniref:Peptidase C14 caspase domain-containing protein n=1 Tax=Aphanomyces euteiches TaxID=100861 RepID=A0A6G0WEI5_9STRA|nr:hypothetical protein Ae201684_015764 [Aphanomyces euteiches]KAH9099499.1 hypothetical protein Ae201684P_018512 [Aphanomyces euteiches]KAH9138426.1 hypothetical protein AeRB84_017264 [Aphanomyces euteiches]
MSFFSNLGNLVKEAAENPEFINKVESIGNQLIDTHLNESKSSHDSRSAPTPEEQWEHSKYQNDDSTKKALFIGINYFGTEAELRGCIKDVENLMRFVQKECGFPANNMRRLTDDRQGRDRPTRANILAGMRWLVENARPGDSLFFHYSGHGSHQKDEDGDEADGEDETICPVDYDEAGMITDDEMHAIMCASLPAGVKLTAIFDCCHSGSVLDLPFMYTIDGNLDIHEENRVALAARQFLKAGLDFLKGDSKRAKEGFQSGMKAMSSSDENGQGPVAKDRVKDRTTRADVILLSGCKDTQTSADAVIDGTATGAMSYAFISTMKEHDFDITYQELLRSLREFMLKEYTQIPCLSAGRELNMNVNFSL